ncbi:hypothetical protein F5Y19DRAFT_240105 [Xylariaceae sp. FL1651]|nr:hypothetical protein F5Y19DRAFT_240105 [Xylariaceae sp. FL1651]
MEIPGWGFDASADAPHESDIPDFAITNADVAHLESSEAAAASASANAMAEDSAASSQRQFHPKRPHRKSRAGCKQCKRRKVKCDEAKPTCKACTLRKEICVYPKAPASSSSNPLSPGTSATLAMRSRESPDNIYQSESTSVVPVVPVVSEPLFIPEQTADAIDMKMLWFYTAYAYEAFSVNAGRSAIVDYTLKVKIVEHAFRSPFLMETLKGLSALHLRTLNQPVPAHKVASYQARAFEGYRNAIETADPVDFPALFACSLLIIAMSSQTFRDPNGKRLFIVDWMAMWRGIGLIVELISPQTVKDSGLAVLFYRPPIDLEKAARFIPNNLLFMVTSIKHGDADFDYQKDYYELLKYLGSLYMEIVEHGLGPLMDLRVITFFTFCPRPLLPLAKELRPRMLIIVAYWLCFAKALEHGSWWMKGLSPQISQICDEMGDEWGHLLRVPRMVMQTEDSVKIAKIIIDNYNWTPNEVELYYKNEDPRLETELKMINDEGTEVEIIGGHWSLKPNVVRWDEPQILDPSAEPDFSNQQLLVGTGLVYSRLASSRSPASSSSRPSTPGLSPSKSPSKSPSP